MRKPVHAWLALWLLITIGPAAVSAETPVSEPGPGAGSAPAVVGEDEMDYGEEAYSIAEEPEVLAKLPKNRKLALNDTMYVPPKVKKIVLPVYPYELLKKKVSGLAKVSCVIGTDGRVTSTTIIEASRPEFGAALAAAVEATEFGYATVEGEPVATVLGFQHTFRPRPSRDAPRVAAVLMEELRVLDHVSNPKAIGRAALMDRPIRVTNQPAPAYPTQLLSRRATGEATIEFVLDEKGRPRLPRIVWATDPAFGYAAAQAVSAWEFDPPTQRGAPTIMRVSAPFRFQMQ